MKGETMYSQHSTIESVRNYYGKVLKNSKDLQTSACCSVETMPKHLLPILSEIHPEVSERFYGCGSPLPPELEGKTVLDLGCGSGRDVYLLSRLVGESGRVIGIDMTTEQLDVAKKHISYHTQKFGYGRPNVSFQCGYIEDLNTAGIANDSIDLIVSNCVVNLSPAKDRVFNEIFRALRPGGELYFSDVYADRRISEDLRHDPVLLGECLGGALYTEDFRRLMAKAGFTDVRVISKSALSIDNHALKQKVGMIRFSSVTVRAFKIEALEDRCEDFGQSAYYLGTIPENPDRFVLDDHHLFLVGVPLRICSNTAFMLSETRYRKHFKIIGDISTHFGLFDCAPGPLAQSTQTGSCC